MRRFDEGVVKSAEEGVRAFQLAQIDEILLRIGRMLIPRRPADVGELPRAVEAHDVVHRAEGDADVDADFGMLALKGVFPFQHDIALIGALQHADGQVDDGVLVLFVIDV